MKNLPQNQSLRLALKASLLALLTITPAEARDLLLAGPCEIDGVVIDTPTDLAVDLDPGHTFLYTVDQENHRVTVHQSGPGDCIFTVGSFGNGDGQLDEPRGVAIDSSGSIYVVDAGNGKVQRFDDAFGKNPGDPIGFIETFPAAPTGSGPFGLSDPHGMGSDSNDRIYVADSGNQRVAVFSSAGSFEDSIGFAEDGDGTFEDGELVEVVDVAVCKSNGPVPGRIYVLDRGREDLQIFSPLDDGAEHLLTSGRSGSEMGELSAPSGISVDHQCNVYIADTGNDRVQMFDRDGGVVEIIGAGQQNNPSGVAAESISSPITAGLFVANGGDHLQKYEWVDYDTTGDGDPDSDGDGYPDAWETDGIDVDNDGVVDLELPDADALHKDIYVEIDFMTDHDPTPAALADAVAAFAAAPVSNPNGTDGIDLHLEVDEEVAHVDDLDTWSEFDAIKASSFGSPAQRADAETMAAKRLVYRYALYVHDRDGCCSSGRAKGGGNFVISLGTWGPGPHGVGTRMEQAGTFVHELGHTLGLGHGGVSGGNYKPNYLSVMSYTFQTGWIPNTAAPMGARLDYSRQELPPLDEQSLDEAEGIGLGLVLDPFDFTAWSTGAGLASSPLDWNDNGDPTENGVAIDLNYDNQCIDAGDDGTLDSMAANDDVTVGNGIFDGPDLTCDTAALGDDTQLRSPGHVEPDLLGSDDWANLDYNFRNDASFFTGGEPFEEEEPELTLEEAREIQDFWEEVFSRDYRVAAKFVCVPEVGDSQAAVRPGDYRTVINVRNPSDEGVDVWKHAVIARSQDEDRGNLSGTVIDPLAPGQAFSVDCEDIRGLFGGGEPIGDGFLVLEADVPLDVSAVYTTDDSVDVEYLEARRIEAPRPDLRVRLPERTTVACAGPCTSTVSVVVENLGEATTGDDYSLAVFSANGLAAQVTLPALGAGDAESLAVDLGPGASCYAPDCEIWARVDTHDNVFESDETNNEAHRVDEQIWLYDYAAKFVCVPDVGPEAGALRPGLYRTVVNIRNPGGEDATLTHHAVIARSEDEDRGPISGPTENLLGPGQALSVDCRDIHALFGGAEAIGDGFLVVRSDQELDVSAVYTADSEGRSYPEIDVEPVPPRRVPASEEPGDEHEEPDLVVSDIAIDSLQVDCQAGSGSCVTEVEVTVANQGPAAAAPSIAEIVLDPAQSVSVLHAVGALAPGDSETFLVVTPPGGSCFDPDCRVCATADRPGAIDESDESNNSLCAEREG